MVLTVLDYAVLLVTALRWLIGFSFTPLLRRNREPALRFLTLHVYLNAVAGFFVLSFLPRYSWVAAILGLPAQLLLILFIRAAFHQGRQSWYGVWMGLSLLGQSASLGLALAQVPWAPVFSQAVSVLVWGWHCQSAWEAYRRVAPDPYLPDWVKRRYQLVVAYAFLFQAQPFVMGLNALLGGQLPGALITVAMVSALASLVIMYLAWGMPEPFRRYLNRHYRSPQVEEALRALAEQEKL